jgi:hypothetical protein
MTPLARSLRARSSSFLAFFNVICADLTAACAVASRAVFGTIAMRAIKSPCFTVAPGSTKISSMMPDTRGLISISLRGTMLPVATLFLTMSVSVGEAVSYSTGLAWDLSYRKKSVRANREMMARMTKAVMARFMVLLCS